MSELPADLRQGLDAALHGYRPQELAASVERLVGRYRKGIPAATPVLAAPIDVAAYAAYRMPATFVAVRAAMLSASELVPAFAPTSLIDLGGGTGAASWAAASVWPSLRTVSIVEQQRTVIAFGAALMRHAEAAVLREAEWQQGDTGRMEATKADLVTMSYVLGELSPDAQRSIVSHWAGAASAVIVVEPGTPAGYERFMDARELLLRAGLNLVAPCPHDNTCPLRRVDDWCHFAARVNRTALHRRLKDGTLGHEDEKFSYAVAVREGAARATARVLRHPRKRKGLVGLRLCRADGDVADVAVSQREGPRYRAARDAAWGDAWE
jgi:ribosomal protein RSM22 (predicted rRNA methylase)